MTSNHEPPAEQAWRNQPQEGTSVRLEEIRERAQRLEKKIRRGNIVAGVLIALALIDNARDVWVHPELLVRTGHFLIVAALIYAVYRFRGHARPLVAPNTLGLTNCVEFYRAQLVRQRDMSVDGWKYVLSFVPGFGLIIVGRALENRPPSQIMTLVALAIVLFVGIILVHLRSARRLDREIDALD
jgi:hypothetical protein